METFPDLFAGGQIAVNVLEKRYLKRNEGGDLVEAPKDLFERVARCIGGADEKYGEDPRKIIPAFYAMMALGDFEPNTPCLANAGWPGSTGQYSACFVLPVPDSMDGVFTTLKNMALIHRSGGGTGFSFSDLRPENDFVRSTTGVASGPVSFMEAYNNTTEVVKQSGIRRGANMGILRVDHPDILQFIHCKTKPCEVCAESGMKTCDHRIRNFNISVALTDAFMAALDADAEYNLVNPRTKLVTNKLHARDVWRQIVENAHHSGEPGAFFVDRVNRLDPLSDTLGPIAATNPCQPAWATVLTPEGVRTIGEIDVGSTIWSGKRWTRVTAKKPTGIKPVYAYRTRAGIFYGTENHRVVCDGEKVEVAEADAIDTSQGMCDNLDPNKIDTLTIMDGLVLGDGSVHHASNDLVFLCIGAEDHDYLESEVRPHIGQHRPGLKPVAWEIETTLTPGEVPLTYLRKIPTRFRFANPGMVRSFLRGLYSANGSVVDSGSQGSRVTLKAASFDVIWQAQEMLSSLGIASYYTTNAAHKVEFENGEYLCRKSYDLNITTGKQDFRRLIGFLQRDKQERLDVICDRPRGKFASKAPKTTYVIIERTLLDEENVFDLTVEAEEHTYWTGGLLVSNCGEVPLRAYDACTLGSINLGRFYVEKPDGGGQGLWRGTVDFDHLRDVVHHAMHFLDNVLTVNTYPIPEILDVTTKCRKVGLGVMGWADLLVKLGVPYASDKALGLAEEVMKFVNASAIEASEDLAARRGPFHYWKDSKWAKRGDKPRRNSTVTVIAPTGSISIIAGCNFGIEPLFALSMVRNQAGMEQHDVNQHFIAVAKRDGWYSDEIMKRVVETGSCQEVAGVPASVQEVFKVSPEIECAWHVKMQAAFQKHTEDAVSKTINLPKNATVADVEEAYRLAWELGCKGITIYRDGSRSKQVLSAGTSKTQISPRRNLKSIPKIGGVRRRQGDTLSVDTSYGTVHVTINKHPFDKQPFECFMELGKSGTETKALTEALGRVSSLHLSSPSIDSPRKILEQIAEQLGGIGGGAHIGFGEEKVISAPDGIAKAILNYLTNEMVEESALEQRTRLDICPKCNQSTLAKGVGCNLCQSCGFSSC